MIKISTTLVGGVNHVHAMRAAIALLDRTVKAPAFFDEPGVGEDSEVPLNVVMVGLHELALIIPMIEMTLTSISGTQLGTRRDVKGKRIPVAARKCAAALNSKYHPSASLSPEDVKLLNALLQEQKAAELQAMSERLSQNI